MTKDAFAHHSASIGHVMCVFVGMSAEVHTSCDTREWSTFPPAQPTVLSQLLHLYLTGHIITSPPLQQHTTLISLIIIKTTLSYQS